MSYMVERRLGQERYCAAWATPPWFLAAAVRRLACVCTWRRVARVMAAVVSVIVAIMVAMVVAIGGGQRQTAGGEQGGGNEQAVDEFHHGFLHGGRGRNGAAIDSGWRNRKNVRLNKGQLALAGFSPDSADWDASHGFAVQR